MNDLSAGAGAGVTIHKRARSTKDNVAFDSLESALESLNDAVTKKRKFKLVPNATFSSFIDNDESTATQSSSQCTIDADSSMDTDEIDITIPEDRLELLKLVDICIENEYLLFDQLITNGYIVHCRYANSSIRRTINCSSACFLIIKKPVIMRTFCHRCTKFSPKPNSIHC